MLELGHSVESMSEVFDAIPRCIMQWVERFNRGSPKGLRDKPKPGRPKAVPVGKTWQAAVDMYKKTSLTPKRLREKSRNLTGVRYAASHVRKMLDTLGFSKRIPNPVHVNASSNRECERWYDETMGLVSRLKRRGFTIIAQSEGCVLQGYTCPIARHIDLRIAGPPSV